MTATLHAPPRPLGQTEFVAMIAMLIATIAFSIDAMLPALPEIAAELTPASPNRAQLIITSFVLGIGLGTLVAGPLSDSFGRRRVIVAGSVLYCLGAAAAWAAPTLDTVLAARIVQGLGAAAPRVVSLALVRDIHSGRQMARVVSFAMMVFTLVPAAAPLLGSVIIAAAGWRAIFAAFIGFSILSVLWLTVRQPETLPPEARRPLGFAPLLAALREVLGHASVRRAILVQALCFGALFGTLSSTQQIFDTTFGRGAEFPWWFALIALVAGSASLLNASLVVRLGMRRMVIVTLAVQAAVSAAMAGMMVAGAWPPALAFPAYVVWTTSVFFMAGLTLGNLNAIALEPMGHVAGMAASVTGALATVAGVALAAPLGLAFDGTPVPLALGIAVLTALGAVLMRGMAR
ncbi:MAG TPA: multidrug effflux MFS transporter [Paracoccaceae bacterium]|mgnify:FL=1|nr:multidrug effflux MFS transporter [Paracoccaceae bacterium]